MSTPVAVLGVGLATALGSTTDETLRRLHEGERAFLPSPLTAPFFPELLVCAPAWLHDARPSRSASLAVTAARQALASAGVAPTSSIELVVGASLGGMHESELELARWFTGDLSGIDDERLQCHGVHAVAEHLAATLGPFARVTTLSSACSSGAMALGLAMGRVARGQADLVLAGGVDALARITMLGFHALGAIDPRGARPFDRDRAGLGLGEGAGFVLLGADRGTGKVFLAGFASRNEAFHATQPEPSGAMIDAVVTDALAAAGRAPEQVGYVSAHGTGTEQNDRIEASALARLFGGRVPVSSQKGALGHTLAACGAIEAVVAADVVESGRLPVSAGVTVPIDGVHLIMRAGERAVVDTATSHSFGFGGTGAVLVMSRHAPPASQPQTASVGVTAVATFGPEGLLTGSDVLALLADGTPRPSVSIGRPSPLRRVDPASALAVTLAAELVAMRTLDRTRTAVVVASAFGVPDAACAFIARALERGPRRVPPMDFPHLVPSAPSSNVAIALGLGAPALSVSDLSTGPYAALSLAADLISGGHADAVVVLAVEPESRVCASLLSPRVSGFTRRGWGGAGLLIERDAGARVTSALVSRSSLAAVEPRSERNLGWSRQGAVAGWRNAPAALSSQLGDHEAVGGRAVAVLAQAILSGQLDAGAVEDVSPRAHGRIRLAR